MTPQELKNSILQLAIQGRLVEQRPEEGTAEELYREIQREKAALVKAGKIKKEKPLPEIKADEVPFEIPDNWIWVRFGSVSLIETGGTPDRNNPEYWYGDIPWIKIGDISGRDVTSTSEFITKKGLENSSAKVFLPRTLLYTIFATIGTVGILRINAATNQAIAGITLFAETSIDYIYYVCVGLQYLLIAQAHGVAQMNINLRILKNTPIPLPPLIEQRRIAEKIEELLPLINRYEKAWNRLEDFNKRFPTDMQKSILQLAIQGKLVEQRPEEGTGEELYRRIQAEKQSLIRSGKLKKEKPLPEISEDEMPFDIPENWAWVRLGDLGSYKKGPFGSALTKGIFVPKGKDTIKVYEQKNAIQKDATLGNYYITKEYFESKMQGFEVQQGDIIVSCAGTIGETYVLPENIEQGIINQALMRMRLFRPIFVPYFLVFFDVVLKQNARASSKGSAIKNIPPFEVLKKYLVPLPPLAEQKRIVAKLEELLPLCERLK